MSAEITDLNGNPITPLPEQQTQNDPMVVAYFKDLLESAEAGEIRDFIVITGTGKGVESAGILSHISGPYVNQMLTAVVGLQFAMAQGSVKMGAASLPTDDPNG